MEILANFLVSLINNTLGKFIFFKVCRKGESIICTYLGNPTGWHTKPSIYFNVPFFQELIKVDMRRQFDCLCAHSFHVNAMEKSLIPYNIAMDFQVEYQIKHPYIIFEVVDEGVSSLSKKIKYEQTKVKEMVENKIHYELSNFLIDQKQNVSYSDFVKFTEKICNKYNKTIEIKENSDYIEDSSFSINSLVITSFDKNISIRSTV